MQLSEEFGDIVKAQEPLAPYTSLKVGGPAEFLVQPRSIPELAAVLQRCFRQKLPLRILVAYGGVRCFVLRLS